MVDKSVVEDFLNAIKQPEKNTNKTYNATVTQVDENNVVWVQVAGSDKETPTSSTSSEVKRGDAVNVEWRNNKLYIAGNYSNPSAGVTRVVNVEAAAQVANQAAANAVADAGIARDAAESAQADAEKAKSAADGASEYAARALGNLSTVQSVAETLTWITQHGTMTLTSDVALDPTHVYFVVDAGGDYTVGGTTYAIVTEPDVADIGTYYELTIDESLNNYVGTHLALTSEGLWLLPAASGTNKVLIATGAGTQYTVAGTYMIDPSGNTLASFRADGATMTAPDGTQIAHLGYGPSYDSSGQLVDAPFYTIGSRKNGSAVGQRSVAEGANTTASGTWSHAEGSNCVASGTYAHAEGNLTTASGWYSHSAGRGTIASRSSRTAIGFYNADDELTDTFTGDGVTTVFYLTHTAYGGAESGNPLVTVNGNRVSGISFNNGNQITFSTAPSNGDEIEVVYNTTKSIFIIGNGTSNSVRSNAFEVGYDGNVFLALDTSAASGTDHDLYAAITALSWGSDVIV